MLHAGLDLSRRRLDVCLVDDVGQVVAHTAAPSVTVDTPGSLPQGNDAESPHAMVDRGIACDADEIGVRTMILFFTNGVLDVDASIDLDFTILVP